MLCSSRRLALLLGLMVCLFMTWGGLTIWDNLTCSDPVRLILLGSVSERRKAAYDLQVVTEDTDIERVMAVLVRASEDRDVEVRAAAAASLSVLASEIVRRPDRTPAEQGWTKRRLDVATRALTRGLSDPEPAVRASAVRGFGELGKSGKVALPPELFAALNDETSSVRQATFEALGAIQLTPAAVPTLIEALGSRDREVPVPCSLAAGPARTGGEECRPGPAGNLEGTLRPAGKEDDATCRPGLGIRPVPRRELWVRSERVRRSSPAWPRCYRLTSRSGSAAPR